MQRYFWDFYGPSAQGTAEHFAEHLVEFLEKRELPGCETGVVNPGKSHFAAWCVAPPAHQATIEKALRPRRQEPA